MTVYSDNFVGANENPLSRGGNWLAAPGFSAFLLSGNAITPGTTSAFNSSYWAGGAVGADQFSRAVMSTNTSSIGVGVRMNSGSGNGYAFVAEPGTGLVKMYRFLAGSPVQLGVDTAAPSSPGSSIELSMVGTLLTGSIDGVPFISQNDASLASGAPSVYGYGFSPGIEAYLSSWTGGDVAPPAALFGGQVNLQRPIGRGPHRGPNPQMFRPLRGGNALRAVTLQIFSSPGIPLASTLLNFWTALSNDGAAIDGGVPGLALSTDPGGYVQLQGLTIPAGVGKIRCAFPGDVTRQRIFEVIFQ